MHVICKLSGYIIYLCDVEQGVMFRIRHAVKVYLREGDFVVSKNSPILLSGTCFSVSTRISGSLDPEMSVVASDAASNVDVGDITPVTRQFALVLHAPGVGSAARVSCVSFRYAVIYAYTMGKWLQPTVIRHHFPQCMLYNRSHH